MRKGSFLDDTFEKLTEQGKTAVKSGTSQIKQTISPTKFLEQVTVGGQGDRGVEKLEEGQTKKPNHTPVDFEKLGKSYDNKEKLKMETLRTRLFQMVRSGEEKVLYEKRQKEMEKKKIEEFEKEEKKRKAEIQKKQREQSEEPKGKVRRSIFSPRKVAERSHAELKPATGKQ